MFITALNTVCYNSGNLPHQLLRQANRFEQAVISGNASPGNVESGAVTDCSAGYGHIIINREQLLLLNCIPS